MPLVERPIRRWGLLLVSSFWDKGYSTTTLLIDVCESLSNVCFSIDVHWGFQFKVVIRCELARKHGLTTFYFISLITKNWKYFTTMITIISCDVTKCHIPIIFNRGMHCYEAIKPKASLDIFLTFWAASGTTFVITQFLCSSRRFFVRMGLMVASRERMTTVRHTDEYSFELLSQYWLVVYYAITPYYFYYQVPNACGLFYYYFFSPPNLVFLSWHVVQFLLRTRVSSCCNRRTLWRTNIPDGYRNLLILQLELFFVERLTRECPPKEAVYYGPNGSRGVLVWKCWWQQHQHRRLVLSIDSTCMCRTYILLPQHYNNCSI